MTRVRCDVWLPSDSLFELVERFRLTGREPSARHPDPTSRWPPRRPSGHSSSRRTEFSGGTGVAPSDRASNASLGGGFFHFIGRGWIFREGQVAPPARLLFSSLAVGHGARRATLTSRGLFLAQRFARYVSPLTTTVYTHPSDQEMWENVRK